MVRQIRRILYTTDLSKSSIDVFEQTVALAAQTGASLAMVHVIEDGSTGAQNRMVHLVDRQMYDKIRSESRDVVKKVLIGKQKSVPLIHNALKVLCDETTGKFGSAEHPVRIDTIEVRYGNAAEEIIKVAETLQCDLIAIGFHKKGSLLQALMHGNTGKSILKQTLKPLFLVPLEA